MPDLEITVTGNSSIHRRAERSVMKVSVSSDGPSQAIVSEEVTSTANQVRRMFNEIAPKTESGAAAPDAAVTVFSMASIRSWSCIPRNNAGEPRPRQYSASSSFEAIFRDFEKLGDIASELFKMPHVQVTSIEWRLTTGTKDSLQSEVRKTAIRDAIQKANDYGEVVGHTVRAKEIHDNGSSQMFTGQLQQQQMQMQMQPQMIGQRAMGRTPGGLPLEPEDVVLNGSVQVTFVSVD
ncbi:MAG: hypothetical protein M1819_005879 [Sarea resinae]|nr:MAG: hypothetical protein M1819_005879 [Sarea resinae]